MTSDEYDTVFGASKDKRHHVFLAKCHYCGEHELCNKAPERAHKWARGHAMKHRGHNTDVIDLSILKHEHEYLYRPQETTEPLF